MMHYHTSVLLKETIELLHVQPGKKYIDATLGGGGHSWEMIKQGGIVLGIDVDQEALDFVESRIKNQESRKELTLARGNFANIDTIARENGFEQVAGVLFDFGVSSHQIDNARRGFSFLQTGPLDMRMDRELSVTAKDLLNGLHRQELMEVFERFGEEKFAHGIATKIVEVRKEQPIETTKDLMNIIDTVMPAKLNRMATAARIFQSLRIIVNDELHVIEDGLPKALSLLQSGGRIAAISFHSLEDRIVKQTFVQWQNEGLGSIVTPHPVLATEDEVAMNSRSRSAKLRVFEKNLKLKVKK